ncbi:MAG TPA: hypothetical protein VJ521_14565, partial [Acidobacteriota bacterium]|nr:hypothetical protein [Acidobacteriota bacterium]
MTNKRGAGVSPAGDGIARISNGGDVRATKEFEDDDPMELQAVFFPAGNAEEQARCFIEEFAMMGMTPQEISKLFSDPFYSGTH